MKPIIGLTTYGRHEIKIDYKYYDGFFAIPTDYVDAVRRAGGVPILLPPGENSWEDIMAIVDGVIIIGGADIHPAIYGGNPNNPNLTIHDPERDASELAFTKKLVEMASHPTLCICRGMQVLNVAMGGTLTEHIPDLQEKDIHRNQEGGWEEQPVDVPDGSLLAEVMKANQVVTFSGHHQAVRQVADGLKITATAADGIIEALEGSEHPWLVAVQWHPEKSAAVDVTQQRLFDELVAAAIDKARRRSSRGKISQAG